ncbi:MAG: hypothetical protein ACLUR5_05090 [Eubacterium ventriosum]
MGRSLWVDSTIDSKFTNCSITGNRIEIDGVLFSYDKESYKSD